MTRADLKPSTLFLLESFEACGDWDILADELRKERRWLAAKSGQRVGTWRGWSAEVCDFLAAVCREHGVDV